MIYCKDVKWLLFLKIVIDIIIFAFLICVALQSGPQGQRDDVNFNYYNFVQKMIMVTSGTIFNVFIVQLTVKNLFLR